MFSRFGTVPVCDRRTDGRSDRHKTTAYTALVWRRAVKMDVKGLNVKLVNIRNPVAVQSVKTVLSETNSLQWE